MAKTVSDSRLRTYLTFQPLRAPLLCWLMKTTHILRSLWISACCRFGGTMGFTSEPLHVGRRILSSPGAAVFFSLATIFRRGY